MKLKTFNTSNVVTSRETHPCIGLSLKAGLFNINRAACDKIGLKEGDKVQFHQEEEEPENWYLEVGAKDGFQLRKKSNITTGLLFNNTFLVRKIFESVSYQMPSGKLKIGEVVKHENRNLVTLITASLRNQ